MFYCDYHKDSVFNFSSRLPESRQIYLAWAKILFTFDPSVTRTGQVVCLQVVRLFTRHVLPALHGNYGFSHLSF